MNGNINIPNFLSMLRILLTPVIFLLIYKSEDFNFIFIIAFYISTAFLDFLDGYLARVLDQKTELGKILDPLADKLLMLFTISALALKTDFPLWIALPVIVRDLLILFGSFLLMKKRKIVAPSLITGKVTFFLLCATVLIYMLKLRIYVAPEVCAYFSTVTFGFLLWSGTEYLSIYKRGKNER